MKKIILLSVFVLSFLFTFSQDIRDSINLNPVSISFSSGQGALSSGPLLNADFSKGKDLISFALGEKDVYVAYLKNIYKNIYSGPSLEFYHNVPTIGLMSSIGIFNSETLSISMLNWIGFSAGKPDNKADFTNWQLLLFYHSISLNYQRLTLSGATLWYESWGYLFDLKYNQPLTKNFSAFTSVGYNFYNEGNYLFQLGISYNF